MTWQQSIKCNITKAEELRIPLGLSLEQEQRLKQILDQFPMTIPQYYLSLIDWDDPNDPILKMSIPSIKETDLDGSFDTSGESDNTILKGLQHKYGQTALILSTSHCAMYCRHCFRKRLVGVSDEETKPDFIQMKKYLKEHTEISNILVSGGDSFFNSNDTIREYLNMFNEIDHLDLIRFGTRTPVVFPERITADQELLDLLEEFQNKKSIYVVTQFNHPKELTRQAIAAIQALADRGICVKNQTVLLKGVNDKPEILGQLLKDLTRNGVVPYYIFQCRPVTGVQNQFQVPLEKGYEIVEGAKQLQNGQGKCIRYVLSHVMGKIEILGKDQDDQMIFKYHQAKYEKDIGRIFKVNLENNQTWLDIS